MTDNLHVEFDRQGSGWPFPAYEAVTADVKKISIRRGRNTETDVFDTGQATVDLRASRDDDSFARNYPVKDPDYVNGFTRVNLDYMSSVEGNVNVFPEPGIALRQQPGIGMIEFDIERLVQGYEWNIARDSRYWAQVDQYVEYVFSVHLQDFNSNTDYDLTAKVYWFTESGGLISDDIFFQGDTPVDVESRIYGKVAAPANAAYASIGSTSNGAHTGNDLILRFSKFMVHKYDAAYELANGTMVKPYANDDLFTNAPDSSTQMRALKYGNQFDINNYPLSTIGGGPFDRALNTINVMSGKYNMESFASDAEVQSFFDQNRITRTRITTDAHSGTQCMRAQTTVAGSSTHTLYFSSHGNGFNWATTPGKTYQVSIWVKNKSGSSATFNMIVRDTKQVSTTILASQSIAGNSAWLNFTGNWTCPAENYSAIFQMTFNAANYDLYIDDVEIKATSGTEPGEDDNYTPQWGDLEGLRSNFLTVQMARNGLMTIKNRFDNTALSPAGPRFLRCTKPTGTTGVDFYFGVNSITYPIWTEAGRTYSLRFWARKVSGTTPTLAINMKSNDQTHAGSFTTIGNPTLTSDWVKYEFNYTAPANASATDMAMVVGGLSGETVIVDIDGIEIVRFQETQVSNSINGLSRTTVYQFEATDSRREFFMSYANDQIDDAAAMLRTYHSGRTRMRYEADTTSIGQNLPVGTVAYIVWVSTNGRAERLDQQAYQGVVAYDAETMITLPTSGTVSISSLAPDIPWRAWVPMLKFVVPSNGTYTFGYTFANEYIGPDGYENSPSVVQDCRFTGWVQPRDDALKTMSIDDKRVYESQITAIDKAGYLTRMKLLSPYQSIAARDMALVHLTFSEDNLSDLGGRIKTAPEIYTRGTPNNWGAEFDSQVGLVGLMQDEGGSWKFTASGSDFSGQLIRLKDQVIAGGSRPQTIGIWFKHTTALTGGDTEVLFNQLNSKEYFDGGAYAVLTEDGIEAGVWSGVSITGYPNLSSDGQAHYLVVAHDGVNVEIYLDGDLKATDTVIVNRFDTTYVGGEYFQGEFTRMFNGNLGQFEIYDYKLTANQVQEHWKAGSGLRKGETDVKRIEYVLDLANQSGVPAIIRNRNGNVPESATTMTHPSWNKGITPKVVLDNIAKSTGGQIFAAGDGTMIYENRYQRFNHGGSGNQSWHIGVGQPIQPELDDGLTLGPYQNNIYNEAVITAKFADTDEGATQKAVNAKSQRRYGKLAYPPADLDLDDPNDALHFAEWIVAVNDKPYIRYSRLVFKYTANAETAEFCRRVRISDYVYGTLALENGLSDPINAYVEKIEEEIKRDGSKLNWITTVHLTPAQNQLVARLDDPTYGILNGEYRLGY